MGDVSGQFTKYTLKDNWDVNAHVMKRNEFGVFEITVPPTKDGKVAIPHESKIKVKIT